MCASDTYVQHLGGCGNWQTLTVLIVAETDCCNLCGHNRSLRVIEMPPVQIPRNDIPKRIVAGISLVIRLDADALTCTIAIPAIKNGAVRVKDYRLMKPMRSNIVGQISQLCIPH